MGDVDVTQYNVEKLGWHPKVVQFDQYDVLMIDEKVAGQGVLPWLKDYMQDQPPASVVLLCTSPDKEILSLAKSIGISACLDKTSLTRSSLQSAVTLALEQEGEHSQTSENTTSNTVQQTKSDASLNMSIDNLTRPSLDGYTPLDSSSRNVRKPRPRPSHEPRNRFSTKKSTVPDIPGYVVLKKVGQGGMSVIYLAHRKSDSKKVVIKVLSAGLSENDTQVIRSNQEFALISRINSPHIVKLYDHGKADGSTYTVMEYFSSGDLKQRMAKGITQNQAISFLRQICSGLAAIHGCGVIHRDLKPANIMFREDDTLAIIDFGISRDINSQLDLTQPGQIIGTPNYMAPEQGNSGYKPDARSDIYAVGVMLFELLTGKKPYRAANAASIIYKHTHDPIPKLPNQYFEMQGIIDQCMAKFPHQRFQSAIDMIEYINTEFRWDITLDFEE